MTSPATVKDFLKTPQLNTIVDLATNVVAGLAGLKNNLAKITAISLTDANPVLVLAANQLVNYDMVLNKVKGSYTITLTDSQTPTMTLTPAQQVSDVGLLGAITSNFKLAGIAVSNLTNLLGNSHLVKMTLADSAANFVSNNNLGIVHDNLSRVSGITLSDPGVPTMLLSSQQQAAYFDVLALITSNYNLANVATVNVNNLLGNKHAISIAVKDSFANVIGNLDNLQNNVSRIGGITLTDTATPTQTLTWVQYNKDATALGKIGAGSPYNLSLLAVPAAQVAAVLSNKHVIPAISIADSAVNVVNSIAVVSHNQARIAAIAIADTAANVAKSLGVLQSNLGNLNGLSITLTDHNPLLLTATQLLADTGVLGAIAQPYNIIVSNVTIANLNLVQNTSHVSSLLLADTANNLIANPVNLASLQALVSPASGPKITGITLTDPGTPILTLNLSQQIADAGVLGLITSNFKLAGVAAANVTSLLANSHVTSLAVMDGLANVLNNLDRLQANFAKISNIGLTDTATPTQSLGWTQFNNDGPVLGKISAGFNLALTGVPSGKVSSALSNHHVTAITVADSAANVVNNLSALQNSISKLSSLSIILTDTNKPTLNLTPAQITADAGVLKAITSPYNLVGTVNAASVANLASPNSHLALSVSDTSQNVLKNLATLENNSGQINSIKLLDAGVPTISLTAAQYNANIDALAEIASPYNLLITQTSAIAPSQVPGFTMRAPLGSSGPVSLTCTVSINGDAPVTLATVNANGAQSVQFQLQGLQQNPGDQWVISVMATDSSGHSSPGQVEMTPGFFAGAPVTSAYSASVNVKFLGLSATGSVDGLPGAYSATDTSYYIFTGDNGGSVGLTALASADKANSVLHQYILAGRVAVAGIDGAVQPIGLDLASPAIKVNSATTIANLGNNLDAGQYAVMVNLPNATDSTTVQMWLADTANPQNLNQLSTQELSSGQSSGGFSGADFSVNGALLQPGSYSVYFTNDSGQPIPGLLAGISSASGGTPGLSAAPSSLANAVTLEVGTVQQILSYAASKPGGTVWYLLEDSLSNIQNAGTVLNNLVAGQQLIGAYISGGIAPPGNGYALIQTPSAIQIGSSQQYVRVFGTDTGNWQTHTALALQTSAAANTVHSVQLYDNGQALGGVQTLTADGSSTLGVSLPAGIALAANVSHQLTAKLDGTPVNIGVVPPGGGVPGAYVPNLNVWVGTVSQMPVSLSAIATNTLYVIQDSAANLAALAASPIQTGAAISLAASGNLVFEVTDGQLTEFQQYLIEKSNLSILNFANQTVSDSLLGLEHAPVLAAGDALLAVDNIAHLLYSSAAIMTGFSAWSWSSGSYNLLGNAFGSGQVVLKDNLAHLLDSNNQAVLENSQTLQALNISTLKSMDVTDTVTNFQSPQFASEYSAIQTLANSLHTSFSLDVVDTLANLQAFLAGGGQFLATYAAHSAVIDNAANLEVAYANGSLSSLLSGLYTSSGHNAGIEVKDSVANLISLFNTPGEAGLYSRLSAVSVVDSAQNILSAFQNGKGSGFDPISIANNIVISDTYAHVLTASQSDPNLLAGVSTINITSAASTGNAALQINLDNSNSNGTNALALPEVVLSYMVGTLTATEVSDNNGGVLVTITDARSNSVSIDLIGVTDSGLSAYTHGGWYHI